MEVSEEVFLLLTRSKDSGFGDCIVIEEGKHLTGENAEFEGEAEDGEAKSKDLAKEVVNFSFPKLAHLGFHNQPTTIPKINANHIGLKTIPIAVQKPKIAGFCNISYKG